MEMDPQLTEGNQKLEEVKLELEKKDENPEKVEQMKPGPLKNFFHIKGLKSSSAYDVTTDAGTSLKFMRLSRVFSRSGKKERSGSENGLHCRSSLMRTTIRRRPSWMNLQKVIEVPANDDDDDAQQEVAINSEIF